MVYVTHSVHDGYKGNFNYFPEPSASFFMQSLKSRMHFIGLCPFGAPIHS